MSVLLASLMLPLIAQRPSKLLLSTNQYQLPLKLTNLFSNYTRVELSQPTVELTLTMESSLLDMELITESITGKSRTHGELHGEKLDISEFSEKWESVDQECADFNHKPHTPMSDLHYYYDHYPSI